MCRQDLQSWLDVREPEVEPGVGGREEREGDKATGCWVAMGVENPTPDMESLNGQVMELRRLV